MPYETITYEVSAGVATITLNRPDKLNSFNEALHKEFIDALKQAEKDPAVRCLVLTGAGRGFCAGQDLSALPRIPIGDFVRKYYNVWVTKLRTLEKPVIAAVNGVAAGAGCGLALMCDLVIASEKAFFTIAFGKIGLVPDTGVSYMLPRVVGYHKAMELALFGDRVTAEQAAQIGLVNRVVPEADFAAAVAEWAGRLAKGPKSMGLTKRMLARSFESTLDEALAQEAWLQNVAADTADAKEAITAFLEKREPNFTGR